MIQGSLNLLPFMAEGASDGSDILAHGQRVAEFLYFLLTLLLRANHEEIDDGEEHDHHDDGGPHALLARGLK